MRLSNLLKDEFLWADLHQQRLEHGATGVVPEVEHEVNAQLRCITLPCKIAKCKVAMDVLELDEVEFAGCRVAEDGAKHPGGFVLLQSRAHSVISCSNSNKCPRCTILRTFTAMMNVLISSTTMSPVSVPDVRMLWSSRWMIFCANGHARQ